VADLLTTQTNFSAGELSPFMFGRGDLRAYENGAAKLRNVLVHPAGGLTRRPGLRYIATARGSGRLLSFEFNTEQVYLIVLTHQAIDIFFGDAHLFSLASPWSTDQIKQIDWTQSADTLLIAYADEAPKKLTRLDEDIWRLSDWSFFTTDSGRIEMPHYKFAADDVSLIRSGASGTVTLSAIGSAPYVFHPDHVGVRFRFAGLEVEISNVVDTGGASSNGWYDRAVALVHEGLSSAPTQTTDWTEQAFSNVRGWPSSVTFHQDRLVIGGSRDLPNHLWLSKTGDLFNFDTGTGLDDEAINFVLLSDQVNAIRSVFSGRHLQVFTSGAEWMVSGDPLTPTTIQLRRQTRIGSPTSRLVPPRDIDGATIFVARNGQQVREFLYTDVEQAYQAADLSFLAQHLINDAIDLDYDSHARILYIVMSNGTMAALTNYRLEQVTAWTLLETDGQFIAVTVAGDEVYALVRRDDLFLVERFDRTLDTDSALTGESLTPKLNWTGLSHLEGKTVKIVADGALLPDMTVRGHEVSLARAATSVQAGLSYSHVVEPLPLVVTGLSGGRLMVSKTRPAVITFRLLDTRALYVDLGRGVVETPLTPFTIVNFDTISEAFTGDMELRSLGWRDNMKAPTWRIVQSAPVKFNLLSVSLKVITTD
jgi:hypothetical protein